MHLFAYPQYTSDTTDFLNGLHAKNPQLKQQQIAGRALLWDKSINREAQHEAAAARVAQQPYVYQTKSDL